MKFLEAQRIISAMQGGRRVEFLLAASGTIDPLVHYIRAEGALRLLDLVPQLLPFNTLNQELYKSPSSDRREIFLLTPWDLAPELDWRSGIPAQVPDFATLLARATATRDRIASRPDALIAYLPAPVPPIYATATLNRQLAGSLLELVAHVGARILSPDAFSAASYFGSGSPIGGASLGAVAGELVDLGWETGLAPAKVVVTDLDEVMWSGVLAEDGFDGVHFGSDAKGFRHFIYQGALRRLQQDGIVLAAVSRNSPEIVRSVLASGRMQLGEEHFVAVLASYSAKSAQIRELSNQLNLGLDSFVFVDDNPVELAEVHRELPSVRCVPFPASDDAVPEFLTRLTSHFPREATTAEDRERTALYRRRLAGMVPVDIAGADLTEFLRGLDMALSIRDCSSGDRTRAVQLINKTNQFNANGRRVTDEEVGDALAAGGRLYTAALNDRTGAHGEILSCLIDANGVVQHFVMSCRVFQRRVEYGFLTWLSQQNNPPRLIQYAVTDRNEPFQRFVSEPAFIPSSNGTVQVDLQGFVAAHGTDLGLFRLSASAP